MKKLFRSPVLSRARLLMLCSVLIIVCLPILYTSNAKAAPLYSCGNGSSGHCYGVVQWPGAVHGAYTAITTNQMHAGDIFVNNELWLIQTGSTYYWVEVGTKAESGVFSGNETLFWADNRPNGGGYANHYGPQLAATDFGQNGSFEITQTSSSTFAVSVYGLKVASINGISKANAINPNLIEIGMELAGSSGATAPWNSFIYNQWQGTNNNWYYQANPGSTATQLPINAYWQATPNGGGNHGGQWSTCLNANC